MVNTILLICNYIYAQRSQGKPVSFAGVIQSIEKYKRIEYLTTKRTEKSN